jgi:hypothetical protein
VRSTRASGKARHSFCACAAISAAPASGSGVSASS